MRLGGAVRLSLAVETYYLVVETPADGVAGPWRVIIVSYIYLLPPEELERAIWGQHDVRAAAQELLCQGHQCFEVTTGVYLTAAEGINPEFL